ncbi:MAG: outer membrane beta-barrel protein [Bacteroidota bacterium]
MLKKKLFIILLMLSASSIAQQKDGQYIHQNLIRADVSIVAGYMLKENFNNVHVNGNLEYYLDNKVSIRGDANFLLGSTGINSDSMGLKDNHSLMLGGAYHFQTKNHFDPYFIIQPGFAYTSSYKAPNPNSDEGKNTYYKGVISPLATAGLGFNFYFQRFAHLFMETRYVYGNHLSEAPHPLSLQEMRFTFGLGFNIL